jgi:hypothetical protein
MIKVSYIFIFFCLHCESLDAQQNAECEILTGLLRDDKIRKVLHLDMNKSMPINFIDTRRFFKNCEIDSIYGREVKVIHDSSYISIINNSNIIINSLKKRGRKYKIELYHKIMEAYGYVELKKKGRRYIVSKVLMGNF